MTRSIDPSQVGVHGTLSLSSGRRFNLRPCGEQGEVWVELSPNLPEEVIISLPQVTTTTAAPVDRSSSNVTELAEESDRMLVTYSVMVYYTKEYEATFSDPDQLPLEINTMMELINEGYSNSKVQISASLFCLEKADIAEIYDHGDQIDALRRWKRIILH